MAGKTTTCLCDTGAYMRLLTVLIDDLIKKYHMSVVKTIKYKLHKPNFLFTIYNVLARVYFCETYTIISTPLAHHILIIFLDNTVL